MLGGGYNRFCKGIILGTLGLVLMEGPTALWGNGTIRGRG